MTEMKKTDVNLLKSFAFQTRILFNLVIINELINIAVGLIKSPQVTTICYLNFNATYVYVENKSSNRLSEKLTCELKLHKRKNKPVRENLLIIFVYN